MKGLEQINAQLASQAFHKGVETAIREVFPKAAPLEKIQAWDSLKRPGYWLGNGQSRRDACPLLLGCLQVVQANAHTVLEQWSTTLLKKPSPEEPSPVSFLQKQGAPISDGHNLLGILFSARAALAARVYDTPTFLQHSTTAARWLAGHTADSPADDLKDVCQEATARSFTAGDFILGSLALLAQRRQLAVGQVRDLIQWFLSTDALPRPLRTRTIAVPYYDDRSRQEGVSYIEVELVTGSGEL